MNYLDQKCNNNICKGLCTVKYLLKYCLTCKVFKFFQLNEHKTDKKLDNFTTNVNNKQHGLNDDVKVMIEEIIHGKNICKPKNIHIKLHKEEYFSKIKTMPTLKQIQNYLMYKRSLIGYNNDINIVLSDS